MGCHQNARLRFRSREALVRLLLSRGNAEAGRGRFSVTPRTAAKWVRRFRELSTEGLMDRSSRPQRL
jgi:hypothetical protein